MCKQVLRIEAGLLAVLLALIVALTQPGFGTVALAETRTEAMHLSSLITSPCEGFFYAGENPGEPPLVQVGVQVQPGMVVGYVQSMEKVPVVAETSGTIVELLVADMRPVSAGQPLFRLKSAV